MADSDCLFCRIVRGEIPATLVHEDELIIAFRDIAPQAPTHILLIPRVHLGDVLDLRDEHGPLLARLMTTAAGLARDAGLDRSGFRLVTNTGPMPVSRSSTSTGTCSVDAPCTGRQDDAAPRTPAGAGRRRAVPAHRLRRSVHGPERSRAGVAHAPGVVLRGRRGHGHARSPQRWARWVSRSLRPPRPAHPRGPASPR